MDFHSPSGAAG